MAKKTTKAKKSTKKKEPQELQPAELRPVTKPDYKMLRKMLDTLFIDGKMPVELSTVEHFFTTCALLFKGKRLEEIGYYGVTTINRFYFMFDYKPIGMDEEFQKFYVDYMKSILKPVQDELEKQAKAKKTSMKKTTKK